MKCAVKYTDCTFKKMDVLNEVKEVMEAEKNVFLDIK
jgi:hypothetical protein